MKKRLKTQFSAALIAVATVSGAGAAQAELYVVKNLRPDSSPNLCLDLGGAAKLTQCDGLEQQKLTTRSYDLIPNMPANLPSPRATKIETGDNRCLEGAAEGQAPFLAPCRNIPAQAWTFGNAGQIKNNGNDLCLDV